MGAWGWGQAGAWPGTRLKLLGTGLWPAWPLPFMVVVKCNRMLYSEVYDRGLV